LLLPAIQASRESARRLECSNHIKQFALAMHGYSIPKKHFPSGGYGTAYSPHPEPGMGVSQTGGFFYVLLPYMEGKQLYVMGKGVGYGNDSDPTLFEANKERNAMPLGIFYCPSPPRTDQLPRGPNAADVLADGRKARGPTMRQCRRIYVRWTPLHVRRALGMPGCHLVGPLPAESRHR